MTRRHFQWPLAIALMLTAGQAAIAQMPSGPPPPGPPTAPNFPPPPVKGGPAGVAAVVNGQRIPRAEIEHTALMMAGQRALQQVIINTLVDQEAKKQGVVVTAAEVNTQIAQVRQQAARYPGGLDTVLKAQGLTLADLKILLKTKAEIQKLATRNQKPVHHVHIHYIVVLTTNPSGDPTKKPHTDAEAQAIIAKAQADLKAGKTFEAVAATYTEDSGKTSGGDFPGVVGPETQADPAFVQAALALKPGEVTATPVHSAQFGYFLLKAVSTSEAPGADKALYAQAEQQQSGALTQPYLQGLLKRAKITNYFTP